MVRKVNQSSSPKSIERPYDVERIQTVCLLNGYQADLEDCQEIWNEYSSMMEATWINLPEEDEEIWNRIASIVESKAE